MIRWQHSFPLGVPLLLLNTLLMSLGFFALIPYLSYYLTGSLLWTPFLAGLLLMLRQFTQQGFGFLAGLVADRIGYKMMIVSGMFVRGMGFGLFALSDHVFSLFLAYRFRWGCI
ncbi:MFS family permease [Bacillus horti]|uniref:MFS family permease n=1 Tax=Caldalkalibacillus horti TaxID=77523 RepID=A0ABT9W2Q2_9BACI|nr:MFS transporter [Bacillus horti]MDQ0167529.1 MFS family permease [Bacillus horti]